MIEDKKQFEIIRLDKNCPELANQLRDNEDIDTDSTLLMGQQKYKTYKEIIMKIEISIQADLVAIPRKRASEPVISNLPDTLSEIEKYLKSIWNNHDAMEDDRGCDMVIRINELSVQEKQYSQSLFGRELSPLGSGGEKPIPFFQYISN